MFRNFFMIILSAILSFTFMGCGTLEQPAETTEATASLPETAEQFLEQMYAVQTLTPCSQMSLVSDLSLTLDAQEMGAMTLHTLSSSTTTLSLDPVSSHTLTTLDVDFGGEQSQTVSESYLVEENGQLVSYIQAGNIWTLQPTNLSPADLTALSVRIDPANTSIDETITQWQGQEAVCLTSEASGSSLQGVLDSVLASLETTDTGASPDLSSLSCEVRLYLDKQTCLPLFQEMSFSGMEALLNPLYEEMGMAVYEASLSATCSFLSFEPQPAVSVPEGAREKAVLWTRLLATGDPDNSDGSFTLRNNTFLLDIVMPEAFTLEESHMNEVAFNRDDNRTIRYNLHYGTEADLLGVVDSRERRYRDLANGLEREHMVLEGDSLVFNCEMMHLTWTSYDESLLFAIADLGSDGAANYYLFVTVTDGYNDGLGNSKSADITAEEFMSYLNAAAVSPLMS